ncbi:unnamed protein product [Pleuronectes platessa]|uniref:Uncharacterized protein n=1 Tax=Pleuronectes platessa TaxID=8262 RepID=A0A9N7YZT8_PLEPL|nr:unnamed protein product [Pleuronectes platessa]
MSPVPGALESLQLEHCASEKTSRLVSDFQTRCSLPAVISEALPSGSPSHEQDTCAVGALGYFVLKKLIYGKVNTIMQMLCQRGDTSCVERSLPVTGGFLRVCTRSGGFRKEADLGPARIMSC